MPNFSLHHVHVPRLNGRAGGVAILVRLGIQVKLNETPSFTSHYECMDVQLTTSSTSLRLCVIYRPPPSRKNRFTPTMFLNEWSALLDVVAVDQSRLLLTGDFNIHVDQKDDPFAVNFGIGNS